MPTTIIRRPADQSTASYKGTKTFTGDVWVDPIHNTPDIKINNVFFNPAARSYWHTHENGQLMKVLAGSGWVCDKGEKPRRLQAGDVVWAAPGTTHWHGGDDGSYMCHLVVSHGSTTWHQEVTDEEYQKKS
ncbi:uncharacterized protein Z518_01780 [Rhinocladiella mackenziei CBS 650.93]|uniref:Rhinocladiella mackenziei CBS 650.93 unplaced genomic scaffold supercont1.1, whole genome shotgun sequence n=1 Tax=Rhinocladiella mackenziei CBS 650.93 TaxID=1442369 RepID=A0A0D2J4P9_9EURO|nr:uncharacterized protein Z518_01780 [Rhinocladiella mackenziei CBS 650.93]KIX10696.1 hypothetical protein Z518_01780 [Rhinocladiella mackenziei CBS 650.93]